MFFTNIKTTIKKYNLIRKGDRILAGVSGGPDSLALVYLLNALRKEMAFSLSVAHLDHALRKGSSADEVFVRRVAGELGLPYFGKRLEAGDLSARGSVEEAARSARLEFLFKTAMRIKANKIALGHNYEDQAETVLMRLLRGTGLMGLAGILPKRRIKEMLIIRPLIEARRSQIEKFLRQKGLRPRLDRSNKQDIYFRNKVRNRLLPLLEKEYNSNIREILANMSESAVCDYDYLQSAAGSRIACGRGRIDLGKALKTHPALRRIAFRNAIAAIQGDTRRIGFTHIREIEDLLLGRPCGSIVDLPGNISVIKEKKALRFYKRRSS